MFGELAWAASPTSTTRSSSVGPRRLPRSARRRPRRPARAGAAPARRSRRTTPRQPARSAPAGSSRADVRVAVDVAAAERDGEERPARAEHDPPALELREASRDEPPGRLPDVAGGRAAQAEAADGRVDAVGADDDVVGGRRSVGEASPAARAGSRARSRRCRAGHGRPRSPPAARRAAPSARAPRMAPTPSQNRRTSISASIRPRWSRKCCRSIGAARASTAGPSPSSPSARTALPGRYSPAPDGCHDGSRSTTSAVTLTLAQRSGQSETRDPCTHDQHTHAVSLCRRIPCFAEQSVAAPAQPPPCRSRSARRRPRPRPRCAAAEPPIPDRSAGCPGPRVAARVAEAAASLPRPSWPARLPRQGAGGLRPAHRPSPVRRGRDAAPRRARRPAPRRRSASR